MNMTNETREEMSEKFKQILKSNGISDSVSEVIIKDAGLQGIFLNLLKLSKSLNVKLLLFWLYYKICIVNLNKRRGIQQFNEMCTSKLCGFGEKATQLICQGSSREHRAQPTSARNEML